MAKLSHPDSQFERFLFATLFEDEETSVSVLSALARQDIDAWQEAARLDRLTKEAAINSLATRIWKVNSARCSPSDASTIAASTIQLLPSHGASQRSSIQTKTTDGRYLMWLVYGILWGSIAISGNSHLESSRAEQTNHVSSAAVQQEAVLQSSHGPGTN